MTLGRPMMTHLHSLPLPSAFYDEDFLFYDGESGQEKVSYISFYIETVKLYQILGRVVTDIYKPWSVDPFQDPTGHSISSSKDEIPVITKLADEMSDYEENISPFLHWDRGQPFRHDLPDSERDIIQRQANILCAR